MDLAQGFDTGSNPSGYILTSVDVAFRRSTEDFGSKLTVTVHKGANGAPGTVVATLTNPAFVNRQDGTYRFTHPGVALEADTRYWVVLDGTGLTEGNSQVKFTQSNSEDAGAAPDWSINNDARIRAQGGGNWITLVGGSTLSMGVNGRAAAPLGRFLHRSLRTGPLKPLGLDFGETFRLLFMTEDHRDATVRRHRRLRRPRAGRRLSGRGARRHPALRRSLPGGWLHRRGGRPRPHADQSGQRRAHGRARSGGLNGQRIAANNTGFWSEHLGELGA